MVLGKLVDVTDEVRGDLETNTRFFLVKLTTHKYSEESDEIGTLHTKHLFTEKELYRAMDRADETTVVKQDPKDRMLGSYFPVTYAGINGGLVTRVSVCMDPTQLFKMTPPSPLMFLFTPREFMRAKARAHNGMTRSSLIKRLWKKVFKK